RWARTSTAGTACTGATRVRMMLRTQIDSGEPYNRRQHDPCENHDQNDPVEMKGRKFSVLFRENSHSSRYMFSRNLTLHNLFFEITTPKRSPANSVLSLSYCKRVCEQCRSLQGKQRRDTSQE